MSWLDEMPHPTPALRLKRALDVAASSAGLAVLAPALGLAFAAEIVFHGWPPFFVQARPGLFGKPFRIFKLRTMKNEARDPHGNLLSDDERLTRFGRLLRETSFDEVPELWNVLVGEMSLVGPRPLLVSYLDRYTPEQRRRHDMPPGMTGWTAVSGRNTLSWAERFERDVWYVDHWSFGLDLEILWRTIGKVVAREGVQPSSEFRGTLDDAAVAAE